PETLSSRANLYYVIEGAEAYNLREGDADSVGIKALDDYTLEVKLHSPVAYFLELINHYAFAPVNQNVVESDESWALEAGEAYVTNGPFVLSEWNHNSRSEEHTSELQSRFDFVCRLLLEKKNHFT